MVRMAGAGSELNFAVDAAKKLEADGKKVRVVSLPCWELFDEQPQVSCLSCEAGFCASRGPKETCRGALVTGLQTAQWRSLGLCLQEYKDSVLPPDVSARVSIEAGSTFGWLKYVGFKGIAIGVDHFGASAPGPKLYEEFGITPDHVVKAAQSLM